MSLKNTIFTLASLTLFLIGCKEDDLKYTASISGSAQKGPFALGSVITVAELAANLNPTGKIFTVMIENDKGEFNLDEIEFSSKYVQLSVDGYFFNELTNQLSSSVLTLQAIVDVTTDHEVSINVLTHLELGRVKQLVQQENKTFEDAKHQALQEVLAGFLIHEQTEKNAEEFNLTSADKESDIQLALSTISLFDKTEGQLTEFLFQFMNDLRTDGIINSDNSKALILQASVALLPKIDGIKANLSQRYQDVSGTNIQIGDFERYLDFDEDNLVGVDDVDDVTNVSFPNVSVTQLELLDSLYYSEEVEFNNITENILLYANTTSYYYETRDFYISTEKVNELIQQGQIIGQDGSNLYPTSGGAIIVNPTDGLYYHRQSSFYFYINGTMVDPSSIYYYDGYTYSPSRFLLKKNDKLKIAVNPFHHFRLLNDQQNERCSQSTSPLNYSYKNAYSNCIENAAIDKTVAVDLMLGRKAKRFELLVDNKSLDNLIFSNVQASSADHLYLSNEIELTRPTQLRIPLKQHEYGYASELWELDLNLSKFLEEGIVRDEPWFSGSRRIYFQKGGWGKFIETFHYSLFLESYYIYINGVLLEDTGNFYKGLEDVQTTYIKLFLKKGDKIKLAINPFQNLWIRRATKEEDPSLCSLSADCLKRLDTCTDEYNCFLEWTKGKTAKAAIILNDSYKTFEVTVNN